MMTFANKFVTELSPYEQFFVALALFSRSLAWYQMWLNWPYFSKQQKVFPVHLAMPRPLVFFTCSGHYLSIIYVVWPLLFNQALPASFAGLVFGVLCGVTIGFWVFVYEAADYGELYEKAQRKKTKKQRAADDQITLTYPSSFIIDTINHLPLLVMFSKVSA